MTLSTPYGILVINLFKGSLEEFTEKSSKRRNTVFDEMDVFVGNGVTRTTANILEGLTIIYGVDDIETLMEITEDIVNEVYVLDLDSDSIKIPTQ